MRVHIKVITISTKAGRDLWNCGLHPIRSLGSSGHPELFRPREAALDGKANTPGFTFREYLLCSLVSSTLPHAALPVQNALVVREVRHPGPRQSGSQAWAVAGHSGQALLSLLGARLCTTPRGWSRSPKPMSAGYYQPHFAGKKLGHRQVEKLAQGHTAEAEPGFRYSTGSGAGALTAVPVCAVGLPHGNLPLTCDRGLHLQDPDLRVLLLLWSFNVSWSPASDVSADSGDPWTLL